MNTEERKKELGRLTKKLAAVKLNNELEACDKAEVSEELVKDHVKKCYEVELEDNDITLIHDTSNDDDAFKALCKEFQTIPGIQFDDTTDHGYIEVISRHSWTDMRNKVWAKYSAADIACGASDNDEVAIYWEAIRDAKKWVAEVVNDDAGKKRASDNLASLEALGSTNDDEVIINEGGSWETMGRDGQIDHFCQNGKDYTLYICAEHKLKFNEDDF